jgi:hypothetical protein
VTDEDSPKRGRVTIRRAGGAENYAIQFVTPNGLIPAQLGIGKSGAGILAVTDAQGRLRAEMWGERGIEVFSSGGQEVAALGMDDASNGALQLNSSGGQVMVTAGTEGPRGSVRTGPGTVCSGNMGLKAPDCLLGRLK